jgi:outer membrane immunogenic protein
MTKRSFDMKKFLIAGAATLMASTAIAADLPSRTRAPAPMPMAPMFTWTGFYVGVNAGGVWSEAKSRQIGNPALVNAFVATNAPLTTTNTINGFTGGGQIGYNQQVGNIVVGLETDLNWVGASKRNTFIGTGALAGLGVTSRDKVEYIGTLRGRLGYAADRFLIYVTGGLAYGNPNSSAALVLGPNFWTGSTGSGARAGWTVGGGIEYALTNNWTIKGEYLYYDLGRKTLTTVPNAAALATGLNSVERISNTGSLARVGVNYKF